MMMNAYGRPSDLRNILRSYRSLGLHTTVSTFFIWPNGDVSLDFLLTTPHS